MKNPLFPILVLFILILFVSCPDGSGSSSYSVPDSDPFPTTELLGEKGPYLDIINNVITNTTADLEYSLDNGTDWYPCTGISQSVSLSINDHVLIRDKTETDIERDLGIVLSTSGRSDLRLNENLFTGVIESNSWTDLMTLSPGFTFVILFHMENLGDSDNQYVHRGKFYISEDRIISSDDTLLISQQFDRAITSGGTEQLVTDNITMPNLPPGIYYIGAEIDSDDANPELNEGNNVTSPEDMTEVIILSNESCDEGAFKIMNSWGTYSSSSSWQHKGGDGHYWMPYEVLKNNKMVINFYLDDLNDIYEPKLISLFQITHENRDNVKIKFGLGDPTDPYLEKTFESYWGPDAGNHPFPDNKLALDLTEFGYAINDYDLFIEIDNSDTSSGTLENFSLEFYSDYDESPIKTISMVSSGSIDSSTISRFTLDTKGSLTTSELSEVTTSTAFSAGELGLTMKIATDDEIEADILSTGLYDANENYNQIYEGCYGTGYVPPTKDELRSFIKIQTSETTTTRSFFSGYYIPSEVDNSNTKYFPPVGNQGQKGSCSLFSVAYYIQTYTEARKHNWDLSSTTWETDALGYSASGAPNSNQDKIFSPDFIFHQINNGEIDSGSSIFKAIEMVLRQGGATWSTMPYRSNASMYDMSVEEYASWGSEAAWREAPNYRGMRFGKSYGDYYYNENFTPYHYGYLVIEDDSDIQLLKSLLAMGYCASTAIHTDYIYYDNMSSEDVVNSNAKWYGLTDDTGNPVTTNHAQTIVGYKEGNEWDSSNPDA